GSSQEAEPRRQNSAGSRSWPSTRTVSVKPAAGRIAGRVTPGLAVPTAEAVQACNQRAADEVGAPERTEEAVKDATSGGVAAVGGGTLYGLNESRRNDEKYRAAYASCMRARGYVAG